MLSDSGAAYQWLGISDPGVFWSAAWGTAAGGLILAAVFKALGILTRWRWLPRVLLAVLVLAAFLFVWISYSGARAYTTHILAFGLGMVGVWLLYRRPTTGAIAILLDRLAGRSARGAAWVDTLTGATIDTATWRVVESDPVGMVRPSSEGLLASWSGAQYARSGYLEARREIDVADLRIDFEGKGEVFDQGWDPGINLYSGAISEEPTEPTLCVGLRFVPAPHWGCTDHSFCLFVSGEVKKRFPVAPGEWTRATIIVSGRRAKAMVRDAESDWEQIPAVPKRLRVGPFASATAAAPPKARYLIRNVVVWAPYSL